jgi:hypothetical protein
MLWWGAGMHFSLPKFLRRVPSESLAAYFEARGFDTVAEVQRKASGRQGVEGVRQAIEALPERELLRIYDDFDRVCQLADDTGQLALRGMIGDAPELLEALSDIDSNEGRALLVLLGQPDAFNRALSAAYAERLIEGKYWDRFSLVGFGSANAPVDLAETLAREIRDLFRAFDGSGRRVFIDHFDRPGGELFASASERLVQYTVYVEALPESSLEMGENGPARRTLRPAREAALCLDYGSGILDVMSKGGRRLREGIASAFAQLALGDASKIERVQRRDFHLDRLKRPIPFPTDQADGIETVRVTRLGLAPANEGYGRLTIEIAKTSEEPIHSVSKRWLGWAEPIERVEWRVVQATLRIAFHPEAGGGRRKIVNVSLRAPNSSDLRNQTWRHQLISEKYLVRWGLAPPK